MAQRESPLGAPCWIDLLTSDPERAKEFYGRLFGWTAQAAGEEYGGYITFSMEGSAVAGGMKNGADSGAPDCWTIYLAADDAQATVEAATAHGGQVLVPAMQVHDQGTMAVISDVGQAVIGIWQPDKHRGFESAGVVATPNWFELHTSEYDAAVRFYRDVFGWETHVASDTDDFRYTTLGEGDTAMAGIMDARALLPAGVPGQWSIYFGVADADAALATVRELGGSVVRPAEDSPFGRLAEAADTTGAHFKIVAG